MAHPAPDFDDSGSLLEARRINERCDRFEEECKRGARPRIEDFVADLAGLPKTRLLTELVLLDVHFRSKSGESPSREGYLSRFPELSAASLDELLQKPGSPAKSPACDFTLAHQNANGRCEREAALRGFSSYERLEFIAQGGMGAVYRGRDTDLQREIALKVLLEEHQDTDELAQRFVDEAQIAGQLQHPGIVPVYELGKVPDGRPYFSMKLIKGETLAQLLAGRKDPREDRPRFLKIFEQICQTLGYAHSRNVIHRDLKPTNVMVGSFGEVQLMDWGLAKVLDHAGPTLARPDISVIRTARNSDTGTSNGAGSHTQSGSMLGTVAYMAPEQALGEVLDQRADVFGLGAILCEILTGKPPYVAPNLEQLKRKAVRAELSEAFERLDQAGLDPELLSLARRMLSAEPADRPADAGQVARELVAYLNGVEFRLRQAELAQAQAVTRAAEERSRRKLTLRFSSALLIVLLIGMLGTVWGLVRAGQALKAEAKERVKAEAATRAANEARERLRRELYAADMQLVDHMWSGDGTAKNVDAILKRQVPRAGEIDLREFAGRLQWTAIHCNALVLGGHRQGGIFCAFDSAGNLVTADGDFLLRRWEIDTGTALREQKFAEPANYCWSISTDGAWIALKSGSEVHVVEIFANTILHKEPGCKDAFELSFSADGGHLAIVSNDGHVRVLETATWQESSQMKAGNDKDFRTLKRIELAPGGKRVYLLNYPEISKITRLESAGETLESAGHQSSVYAIAISADGQQRATGDANGVVYLTDEDEPDRPREVRHGHRSKVTALTFSGDGSRLAMGFEDGMVTVWGVVEGKQLRSFRGHQGRIRALSFAADKERLGSISDDGTARVWNQDSGSASQLLGLHQFPVFSLAYSPDGEHLAVGTGSDSATPNGVVQIWSLKPRTSRTFEAGKGRVMALAYSPDGRRLFTGGYDSQLHVWDPETGDEIPVDKPAQHAGGHFRVTTLGTLAVAPRGAVPGFIVAGFGHPTRHQENYEQIAKVCDLAGNDLKTLNGHQNVIGGVAVSHDGQLLATASDDKHLILWSTKTWQPLKTFREDDELKCVTFSSDDKWVVAGDADGGVSIWETGSGELVRKLQGHADAVYQLAFSPDGKTLATASWDSTVKLWDPICGREMRTLRDHQEWVSCLAFSPDGNTLATGSFDRTVRLWEAKPMNFINANSAAGGSNTSLGDK